MDNGRCVRDFVWASSQITANMICANSAEDKDICQGDSGGPMMANEGAYYSVIGKLTLFVITVRTYHNLQESHLSKPEMGSHLGATTKVLQAFFLGSQSNWTS